MYLCISVILAVVFGLARGGKWNSLIQFKFKRPWLVLIAIALQFAIFNPLWGKIFGSGRITNILYVLSIVFLVLFIMANKNVYGLMILGLGVILNSIAIITNGGYMPSSLEALKNILPQETINQLQNGSASNNVVLISEHTRLKFLCDIFYVPHINVYSVGDIAIAVGAFITVQQIMQHRGDTGIFYNKKMKRWC